ncbi:MAG: FecR family protein [Bacteroidetes bacterium]|nr:FecR family protein [Bacteroidota bacterium]
MNHIDRILLLHKRLTGRLTDSDRREYNRLMKSGEKQEKESQLISRIWETSGSYPNSFQPNVDKAWLQFKEKMDDQPVPAPMRPLWRRNIMRVAAALLLLVSAWSVWQYTQPRPAAMATVSTAADQQQIISLPDGTQITLAENSLLTYPENFEGETRDVKLSGKAFFEVAHNPESPFVIEASHGTIEVLGTSFMVRSYAGNGEEEVLVKTGKVKYQLPEKEAFILRKGDKVVYDQAAHEAVKSTNASFNALAWFTGDYNFSGVVLEDVLKVLEQNFGLSFQMDKMEQILKCKVSGSFPNHPSAEEILAAISLSFDASLEEVNPNQYVLTGGTCK